MKTTKVGAGYYKGIFDGVEFEIIKIDHIDSNTKNKWYWKCNGVGGYDWFSSKSIAIEAVTDWIKNDLKK